MPRNCILTRGISLIVFSISTQKISTVSINATGEWLAFGSKQLGQLLVWEWRSETYVLKQQVTTRITFIAMITGSLSTPPAYMLMRSVWVQLPLASPHAALVPLCTRGST